MARAVLFASGGGVEECGKSNMAARVSLPCAFCGCACELRAALGLGSGGMCLLGSAAMTDFGLMLDTCMRAEGGWSRAD